MLPESTQTQIGKQEEFPENKIDAPGLGKVRYDKKATIVFSEGLIGFENDTRFVIVEKKEYRPFKWLLSIDNPILALPIVDPQLILSDYKVELNPNEIRLLGLASVDEAETYVIVNVGDDRNYVTANLRGPVLINRINKLGRQFILFNSSYSLRHKILTDSQG